MTPYREAPQGGTWPPPITSTRRLVWRWVLDLLARVFMGRPRLGAYLAIRALSRVSYEDRVRYAYRVIGHPKFLPIRSEEDQLRTCFEAGMAELRATGHGFKRRYRSAPWCPTCSRGRPWYDTSTVFPGIMDAHFFCRLRQLEAGQR